MFVDSHAHLEFPDFDGDREEVFERALASGVQSILAIGSGTGPHRLRAGLEMAEGKDWVHPTVGIHPHEARLATEDHFAELARLAADPRVVAMGELGLDYHYDHSPREIQQQVFLRQIELAEEAGCPWLSTAARPGRTASGFWNSTGNALAWGAFFIASAVLSGTPAGEWTLDSWFRSPAT